MSMNDITERKVSPGVHNRIIAALFLFISSCLFPLFSEETSFPGVFRYRLENGLELFVAENSSAPLASIHIASKTGSVSHTPENAGLVHLYEHMLFKGNAKYENEVECTQAMNKMGAINHNAYTSVDIVNYYFTIPSSQLKNGLEFWSYAVRTPKFDKKELDNEIQVVLSEINGGASEPGRIRVAGLVNVLYPDKPWTVHPAGNPEVVRNATPEQMKKIQSLYYVPENSAVFVGGDVHHEEVFKLVKEIFGDWKSSSEKVPAVTASSKDFPSTKKLVFVHPGSSDSMISASLVLRGPDGQNESDETYAADVWSNMVQNPSGAFASVFVNHKELGIPDADYVSGQYSTARVSSQIVLSAALLSDGQLNPFEKAQKFYDVLRNEAIPLMADKNRFLTENALNLVVSQLEDSRIYQLESADSILSNITSCWSSCNSDYFFSYDSEISKVTADDVVSFVQKYIQDKNGAYLVTVSPEIWKKHKADFEKAGYSQITQQNAYWFNK